MARSRLAQSMVARMLSSLSSGKPTMKGKCPATPCPRHLVRGLEHLLDADVLADALEHFIGAGLDPDQQAAQARLHRARPQLIRQAHALIRPHGAGPGELEVVLDQAVDEGLDAAAAREEGLVLEVHVIEAVALPQLPQAQRHAYRVEADPLALIDERVGAERAAEVAALRGDVIELALALELEVALDRDQRVVVRAEHLQRQQRPRRHSPAPSHPRGAPCCPGSPSSDSPALRRRDDLREGSLALPAHDHVHAGLARHSRANMDGCQPPQTTGSSGRALLGRAGHAQRVRDRRAGQHGDSRGRARRPACASAVFSASGSSRPSTMTTSYSPGSSSEPMASSASGIVKKPRAGCRARSCAACDPPRAHPAASRPARSRLPRGAASPGAVATAQRAMHLNGGEVRGGGERAHIVRIP